MPNKIIKIQTSDGSVFVYEMDQIAKITKEPPVKPIGKAKQDLGPPGKFAIQFNPLGFLQFGPSIETDFAISDNMFFHTQLRFASLGLAYYAIASDGFENEVALGNMAIGVGFKLLQERAGVPHRFYSGGAFEYQWESKSRELVFWLYGGHRWRYPTKSFLNLGFIGGVAIQTKNEWWYTNNTNDIRIRYDPKKFLPILMLELSFGWES